MLLPAVALLVAAAPAAERPAALCRHAARMVEVAVGGETVSFERGVASAEARAIHAYRRTMAGRIGSRPVILRVPGRPGTYLVSDLQDPGADGGGRRLVLLRREGDRFRELARSAPAGDSPLLRPVLFTGAGRTIVLAAIGTETSWGALVYELSGDGIRALGAIDATRPGPDGAEEDPTPCARVAVDGGRVVVRFECDLWLGSGQNDAPLLQRPVVFREEGDGFALVRPRPPTASRAR